MEKRYAYIAVQILQLRPATSDMRQRLLKKKKRDESNEERLRVEKG